VPAVSGAAGEWQSTYVCTQALVHLRRRGWKLISRKSAGDMQIPLWEMGLLAEFHSSSALCELTDCLQ